MNKDSVRNFILNYVNDLQQEELNQAKKELKEMEICCKDGEE